MRDHDVWSCPILTQPACGIYVACRFNLNFKGIIMTLSYGWVTQTQRRISDALVGGRLTGWEMSFIQSIDITLETYRTDSKISRNQHQKLFAILTKAESSGTRNDPSEPRYQSKLHPKRASSERRDDSESKQGNEGSRKVIVVSI
jgi:hypothetical protein